MRKMYPFPDTLDTVKTAHSCTFVPERHRVVLEFLFRTLYLKLIMEMLLIKVEVLRI